MWIEKKTLTKSHDYSRLFSSEKRRLKNTGRLTSSKYAQGLVVFFTRLVVDKSLRTKAGIGTKRLKVIAELGKPRKIVTHSDYQVKFKKFALMCFEQASITSLHVYTFLNMLRNNSGEKTFFNNH